MVSSRLFASVKRFGIKGAGLFALAILVVLTASFSFPNYYSAHAAGWLEKIFGDFKTHHRSKARSFGSRASQQEFRQKQRYRKSRGRKAYGIGKIGAGSFGARNKKYLSSRIAKVGKTYRTMCVRTCDGYFFPVSFSTGKRNFKKDAKTCKSSCGAPTRLYYYPNPGSELEDMVSYRGKKKYKKLKNAFRFKKEFIADCRCKPEPWSQASKQRHLQYARTETKRLKQVAAVKKRYRSKKRYAKRRLKRKRNARKYTLLKAKNRSRYIRRVGSRKASNRRTVRPKRRIRRVRTVRRVRRVRVVRRIRTVRGVRTVRRVRIIRRVRRTRNWSF